MASKTEWLKKWLVVSLKVFLEALAKGFFKWLGGSVF